MQSTPHIPSLGLYGNCYSACLASILELELDEVPFFMHPDIPMEKVIENKNKWFMENGLRSVEMPFLDNPLHLMGMVNPGIYYIFSGNSEDDVGHSVVCIDDEIVHDPAGNIGIHKPFPPNHDEMALYWIEFFVLPITVRRNND